MSDTIGRRHARANHAKMRPDLEDIRRIIEEERVLARFEGITALLGPGVRPHTAQSEPQAVTDGPLPDLYDPLPDPYDQTRKEIDEAGIFPPLDQTSIPGTNGMHATRPHVVPFSALPDGVLRSIGADNYARHPYTPGEELMMEEHHVSPDLLEPPRHVGAHR